MQHGRGGPSDPGGRDGVRAEEVRVGEPGGRVHADGRRLRGAGRVHRRTVRQLGRAGGAADARGRGGEGALLAHADSKGARERDQGVHGS